MKEAIPKIIIPVRMKSSRLSGKPLLDIQGVPMVIRVAQTCKAAVGLENIIISTPDDEIREVVTEYGFNSVMSGDDCVSGTDRLYEYALNHKDNLIINVQGDEPMITQEIVKDFYTSVVRLGKTCIGVSQISNESEINSEGVVKVAISGNRIIYASRKPIGTSYKNQSSEEIEILRLIERHKKVYSVTVPNFGRAVDTPEDYEYVNRYFQNATSAIV